MTFQVKRILIVLINIMCYDPSEKFYTAKNKKMQTILSLIDLLIDEVTLVIPC